MACRDYLDPVQGDGIVQYPPRAFLATGAVLSLDRFAREGRHGKPYRKTGGCSLYWEEARPRWCLVARFTRQKLSFGSKKC